MQHIVAARADAVDMVADTGEATVFKGARFLFHEFLEPVSV